MCKIDFISKPSFSFEQKKIVHFLKKYAEKEGFRISQIQYNFVTKPYMLKINKDYLDHDSHTDIVTFDYSKHKVIKAEVYISTETMKKNAKKFAQTLENEAVRLISHALFHCMGYSDKNAPGREKMRNMEEKFIDDVSRETINNV